MTDKEDEHDDFDYKKLIETERRVLRLSGLSDSAFNCRNVEIGGGHFIRTIEVGDPSKPKLVLIHGYGASSINFWKIVGPLSERYHVFMIDIIGMGASSRPKFTMKDPREVDRYLVAWLEAWRLSVGLKESFILAGHSFGGYLSGLYVLAYPEKVKKLLMLSPLGVSSMPDGFDLEKEIEKFPEEMRPPKFAVKAMPYMWKFASSPYAIMRASGPTLSNYILDFFISKRFQSLASHEIKEYKEYMKLTLLRRPSTDNALFVNFNYLLFAHHPLESPDRLGGKHDLPVSFFFGDRDWMIRKGSESVLRNNRHPQSRMHIIPNSDHHLYFDNPQGLVEAMLRDLD